MGKLVITLAAGLLLAGYAHAQPAASPAAGQRVVPTLAMVRVYVKDMRRTERLLQESLGMRLVAEMDAREHVMMFPGQPAGPGLLILQANAENPERNGASVVRVADVDDVLGRAVALGATVAAPTKVAPEPDTKYAMFRDYDGTLIQVTQYPESQRQGLNSK